MTGILLGLVYTLMAVGLSLAMGVLRVINVAHSVLVVLGGYLALEMLVRFGIDPIFAIPVAGLAFFVLGCGLYVALVARAQATSENQAILVLFGLMLVLESAAILLWTTDVQVLRSWYSNAVLAFAGLSLPLVRLLAGVLALCFVLALHVFLHRTIWGTAIRALGENPEVALVLGVNVPLLSMAVYGLGVATAAIGGVTLGLIFPFAPQDHVRWLAWSFLVVVTGGLGGPLSTLAAGLLVGVIEAFAGVVLPFAYVQVVLYLLLAAILLVRRGGLMAKETRTI